VASSTASAIGNSGPKLDSSISFGLPYFAYEDCPKPNLFSASLSFVVASASLSSSEVCPKFNQLLLFISISSSCCGDAYCIVLVCILMFVFWKFHDSLKF